MKNSDKNFWEAKLLSDMSQTEWESLCDGCGKCCLNKLEDEETGEVFYTDAACRLLDISTCRCTAYFQRTSLVKDCLVLTPEDTREYHWLPKSCAYRLVMEKRELPPWHPLVSKDPNSVHLAGASVRGWAVSENGISEEQMEERIIHGEL